MLSSRDLRAPFEHGSPILRGHSCPEILSEQTIQALNQIARGALYPEAAFIFVEGQKSRGVYVLREGQVKLSGTNPEGKTLIVKIAQPGEILGLHNVFTGCPHTLSAETLQPCELGFIGSSDFLAFLKPRAELSFLVMQHLISDCNFAYEVMRSIVLSTTVTERLARLFLQWSVDGHGSGGVTRLKHLFTHEEISHLIGATRETVTRALGQLRNSKVVEFDGTTLAIWDRAALERIAQSDRVGTRDATV